MKWFTGTIPEAIQASKTNGTVFIVYIAGEDDLSKQMNATWDDAAVSELCEKEGCVAVKISANSDECGFFSQIYPVVVVPSTFFIGANGVPLEVTGGYVSHGDFLVTIQSVLKTQNKKQPTAQSSAPVTPVPQAAEVPPQAADASEQASTSVGTSSVEQNDEATDAKKPKVDLDDKVARAKDLIEQKKIEKTKKEEEEMKAKEQERIKLGREVQKLRQYQQEREIKETHDQLKKDREEDRKARERVKEQIARDRAERAARFNKEKETREKTQEEAKRAKLMAQQQAAAEAEARRSEIARLQFRLPDGSSVAQQFPSGETLQQAYNFVSQHVGGAITMSTTFPRRTFTDADMSQSFVDLQLVPSAVIMVVPGSQQSVVRSSAGGAGFGGILDFIFAPFLFLLNFLRSLFSSSASPSAPPPRSSASSPQAAAAAGGDRAQGAYQRRSAGSSGGVSRQEGKVHRFRNEQDDDDETATWNGNSTQQM